MRDKILGDIEFDDCVWWRSMQKSLFGSDEDVELLIQDENNEGILDVQREAFLTYEKNEDRYIKDVPRYIIDYYKWYFEVIEKRVKLDEETQKKVSERFSGIMDVIENSGLDFETTGDSIEDNED